jgi:CheY-like chemotaxis protein
MSQAPTPPARKVLFVDGENLLRDVYREEARRAGFEPILASSGGDAWAEFQKALPDAVVTDLVLPGRVSGSELITRVRGNRVGNVIPVIAVAAGAKSIRGATDAVIAHDVDDYLEKPVHGERLMWRLGELINGRAIGVVRADGALAAPPPRPVVVTRNTDFLQGRLSESDIATLFFSFFATSRSGKLCLMSGREVVQVWFRRGFPVFAESNASGSEFGEWLLSRGRVDPRVLGETRQEWESSDRKLGVLLVARGAIGARSLFEETRANVDSVLRALFAWTDGTYWLEYLQDPGAMDAPEVTSLQRSPAHYVVQGARDHYPMERCREMLGSIQGSLKVAAAAHFILRELEDPYYYENVLAAVGSGVESEKLLRHHPFARDSEALSALTALWVVGGVVEELGEQGGSEAAPGVEDRVRRIRAAVAAAAKEHPEQKLARDARVRQKLKRPAAPAKKPRSGGVASIMNALDRVSAEVAFENGCRLLALREHARAAVAFREAAQLSPNSAQYLLKLAQSWLGDDRAGPEELDESLHALKRAIQLEPDRGEPYYWLGMVLVRMGHRDEARLTFRRAVELGAEHGDEAQAILESM